MFRRAFLSCSTALFLVCAGAPPVLAAAHAEDSPPTLTVQGDAEVSAAPDRAIVRMGATVEAPEAAAAQRGVNEILNRAIERIRSAGVPPEKIQTAQLTLGPVYGGERPPAAGEAPGPPRIVGYRATNTVEVTLDEIARIGAVIDAGVASGANELQGVTFGLRDDAPQRLQALQAAAQEAQRKARALAEATGVQILHVRSIREDGPAVLPWEADLRVSRMEASAGAPVEPGQVRVRASVTMSFALAPRAAPTAR